MSYGLNGENNIFNGDRMRGKANGKAFLKKLKRRSA